MWIPTLFSSLGSLVLHFSGIKWLSSDDTPFAKWRSLTTSTRFNSTALTSHWAWFSFFSSGMLLRP